MIFDEAIISLYNLNVSYTLMVKINKIYIHKSKGDKDV